MRPLWTDLFWCRSDLLSQFIHEMAIPSRMTADQDTPEKIPGLRTVLVLVVTGWVISGSLLGYLWWTKPEGTRGSGVPVILVDQSGKNVTGTFRVNFTVPMIGNGTNGTIITIVVYTSSNYGETCAAGLSGSSVCPYSLYYVSGHAVEANGTIASSQDLGGWQLFTVYGGQYEFSVTYTYSGFPGNYPPFNVQVVVTDYGPYTIQVPTYT